MTLYDTYGHQASMVVDNNDDKSIIVAPCVPIVLGTKRERSRVETVVRRSKFIYRNELFKVIKKKYIYFISFKFHWWRF